jgi:TIR domain/Effector-associated domain 9
LFGAPRKSATGDLGVDSAIATREQQTVKDFFVSYNRADKQWAEWIAWTLEEAGYSVVIQAWDFRPGGNFVLDMQRAAAESEKTIAVLSETYLKSSYTQPEWAAAFTNDPESLKRKMIPIRVKECQPTGMLQSVVYVDLVGVPRAEAKQKVLESLRDRIKPESEPLFPGEANADAEVSSLEASTSTEIVRVIAESKVVPNALSQVQQLRARTLQLRIDALMEDYHAVAQQLNHTNNAAERTRLERQLTTITQEMEKVAADLDALGT